MRAFYATCLALIVFFSGCDKSSDLITDFNDTKFEKANWIPLPDIEGMHTENSFTVTKRINGTQGGFLTMNESYVGGPFGTVTINAELIFEQGAYPGNKYITITNNDAECVSDFEPSFDKFNRLVTYSICYAGIDLSNINPENVKFAYIALNGEIHYAQYESLSVNLTTGTIQVVNAIIPHFSRYGFVN